MRAGGGGFDRRTGGVRPREAPTVGPASVLVAAATGEADVQLLDLRTATVTHHLFGHTVPVWAVTWSPANQVSQHADTSVNLEGHADMCTCTHAPSGIKCCTRHRHKHAVARAHVRARTCTRMHARKHTNTTHQYAAAPGVPQPPWLPLLLPIPSQFFLVSGACDGSIRMWDVRRSGCLGTLDPTQAASPEPPGCLCLRYALCRSALC